MTVVDVKHRRHVSGLMQADLELLETPEAQPVIARIGASVDPDYPGRMAHVLRVASIAVRAKKQPNNAFAEPTL